MRWRWALTVLALVSGLGGWTHAVQNPTPIPLDPTQRWPTQITFNWDANGNHDIIYFFQVDTSTSFSSPLINLATQFTSWTMQDLDPGTTYFARVRANYASPDASPYAVFPGTTTLVSGPPGPAPIDPIISSVTYSMIVATWTSPGSNHGYSLEASTAPDFSGSILHGSYSAVFSSASFAYTISGSGLASATTYYVRVGAQYRTHSGVISYAYAVTTPPSVVTDYSNFITGLTATPTSNSILWTWNPVADATSYNIYLASATSVPIASVSVSSYTDTGLSINTQYGRAVSAVVGGLERTLSAATSSYTLTRPPGTPTFANVGLTTATMNWDANGNPDGTFYEYTKAYSYGFGGILYHYNGSFTSTTTFISGLAEGCSFYFHVVSRNAAGVRSASAIGTLVTPGTFLPRNVAGSATGTTSILWSWGAPAGASSYAFYPAANPASLLGTTSGLFYPRSGLSPNTAYGIVLRAFHDGNIPSDLTDATTVYTWAAVPGIPVFSIGLASTTLSWSAQGNSLVTPYEITRSTVSDFSSGVVTVIPFASSFTATTTTFIALAADTYYFRVRARNGDGITTAYSPTGIFTATSNIPSTVTGSALTTTSILWGWDAVSGATAYNLYIASSPATRITGPIASPAYTETGLSTNTVYGRVVTALFGVDESSVSVSTWTATMASVPLMDGLTAGQRTDLILHWFANQNPPGTMYRAQVGNDSGFITVAASSFTAATSAELSGLAPNYRYYLRVQAINADGVATDFTESISTITPALPSRFGHGSTSDSATSIRWYWPSISAVMGYRVISATGVVSGDLSAGTTFWTETGLTPNTGYSRNIVAFNDIGQSESFLSDFSERYTLAAPIEAISISDVAMSSMTVSWTANGNPGGTEYTVSYHPEGQDAETVVTSSLTAVLTGLSPGTTYQLTLFARNQDHYLTPSAVSLSTVTAGILSAQETVNPDHDQTVVLNTAYGSAVVEIPPQSFSGPVQVTLQVPGSYPGPGSAISGLTPTGLGVEIILDTPAQPQRETMLWFTYSPAEIALRGLDERLLIVARYDPTAGLWLPLSSRVDTVSHAVYARTPHFSLFQIMQAAPAATLSNVVAYPNPLRPSRGDTEMRFVNVPANTRVRIYTLVGEQVQEIHADANGVALWDGTNASGRGVASGVYFVVLEGGSDRQKLRVAVQR